MSEEVDKAFKEYKAQVNKEYKQRPEVELRRWNKYLKKNYGITADIYNALYIKQEGRCNICGRHSSELNKRLSVDIEEYGVVRGLLCNNCTSGLGNFKDNPEILKNAIRYLNTISLFRE